MKKKSRSKLNCFNFFWKFHEHPLKWFREFFYCCRDAYQRIIRGFSNSDLYDLDQYYANLMGDSLRAFADQTHSYPAVEGAKTPEEWKNVLYDMAAEFYGTLESETLFDGYDIDEMTEEDWADLRESHREDWDRRMECAQTACEMLDKWFFDLWD